MELVVQAIPFVLLAVIVGAILARLLRRRLPSRPPRPRRAKPPKLRVSQSQMDDELRDLIKRR